MADLAVDGLRGSESCTHAPDVNPWWAVDLRESYHIGHVVVTTGYGIYCRPTLVVELASFINSFVSPMH